MAQETGPWTEYQPTAPADDGPWSEYAPVPEKKPGIARKAADLGLSVAKGVVGVPEAAVGLADIVSGGRTGKFLENEGGTVGFRPKQAKEYLGSLQSDALQGQKQEFADADGILDKTGVALTNPALIANTVAESVPLMLGGGAVARGAGKVAPSIAGRVGTTAAGEGAVMAGSQAEQIRQETEDGLLTPKQAALAAGTGVIGAGLGVAGARAARALGVGDVDQMIAQGVTQGVARPGLGIANRAGRGALTEGVFEELPQSLAETGLQNIALDRPVTEGMTDAAVLGTLAGGAMGGGAGVVSGLGQSRQPGQPEAEPFTPAPEMAADPLTGEVAAPPQEQATAGLPVDSEQVSAPAAAPLPDAEITDITPIRETQTPSQAMGIDPNAGSLSKAAATAVDTGVSQEMQAQQAAKEMAKAEQEAAKVAARQRPKAESPGIDKSALETRTDEELRGFLRSAQNADVRKAVSAELAKRKQAAIDAMPDPLQPSLLDQPELPTGEPARVAETAQAVQSRQEEPPAPAAQPAGELKPPRGILAKKAEREALGRPLTDTGAGVLGSPADPLQAVIQGENDARRATQTAPETTTEPAPADAGSSSPVPQADQPATGALTRPPRWRNNALQAGKIARDMGLDPKGKKLPEILAEIDAVDSSRRKTLLDSLEGLQGITRQDTVDFRINRLGDDIARLRTMNFTDEQIAIASQQIEDLQAVRADAVARDDRDLRQSIQRTMLQGERDELNAAVRNGEVTQDQADAIVERARATGNTVDAVDSIARDLDQPTRAIGTNVQNPPQRTAGTEAQAPAVEAPAPEGGDAAAAGGVPAATGAGDGQADGVKPEGIAEAANQAATSPNNDLPQPTDAQKEAGNYSKGHVTINGHGISIENPAGSKRRPEWPPLKNHYGYFKGSTGADKDHVDVFLTDRADDPSLPVFVVDQVNRDGSFDEHKIIMGTANEAEARATYLQNYEKGWTGLGAITQMSQDEFKAWVRDPAKTKKPVALKRGVLAKMGDQKTAEPADVEAIRRQLVEVENKIVGAAGLSPDFIEDAMKSRKVPLPLKKQRKELKDQLRAAPAPQAAPRAEPDYLEVLFGTTEEQARRQAAFEASNAEKASSVKRIRDAIASEKKRAKAEYDDWAGRVYKGNKAQVDLRGDGPSNRASMSIGAINESRRRNAMEALNKELTELDKLGNAVESDIGAERVIDRLSELMQMAEAAVGTPGGLGMNADQLFESMLLDGMEFRGPGGKGNVQSNGLSKALLAAFKNQQEAPAQAAPQQEVAEPVATELTPKQFHDAKLKFIASRNDVSMAEVREMYDTEGGRADNNREWLSAVQAAAGRGEVLTRQTLDKLYELAPNARMPESSFPDGYQKPDARKTEAEEKQARIDNRVDARQAVSQRAAGVFTKEDAQAAERQVAQLLGDRIDAMQATEVQRIARRFLPSMGMKVPAGKARIKEAVTDFTKVNPLAAAGELGVELSDPVRRPLDAQQEGRLVESTPPNAEAPAGGDDVQLSVADKSAKDLIVTHNLTEGNLMHAIKIGGIPVPSLAVTKKNQALSSFGDITLIGKKEMADPKGYAGTQLFGADIYSPRYPNVEYKLGAQSIKALNEKLKPFLQGDRPVYGGDEITRLDDLTSNKAFKRFAANSLGESDVNALGYQDLKGVASALITEIGAEERIFQGFTNSGNRKYIPHTLDNVVKILKKELRGGENFSYGVGSVRAKFTPKFRSVSEARKGRDRLVSKEEFAAVKKDIDEEFFKIGDELRSFHPGRDSFGYSDAVALMMSDSAKMGVPRAMQENGFQDVSPEAMAAVRDYLNKLRNLPTEYFEAKILRPVALAEFAAAVVPEGTDQKVIDALRREGITTISTYKGDAGRTQAVQQMAEGLDDAALFRMADPTQRATPSATSAATQANQAIVQSLSDSINAQRATKGSPAVNFQAVEPAEGTEGQLARAIAKTAKRIFNREVVYVRFDGQPLFNGAVSKLHPGKIFINIDSERPMMAVLGHELLHELAKSSPGTYANLSRRLDRVMRNQNIYSERLKIKYRTQGQPLPADIMEELEADIVGDNFMDPQFWQEMSQEQPGLFRAMANQIIRWLDKVAGQIRRMNPFGTELFLTDIAAARSAVAEAMREFSRSQVTIPADTVADTTADAVDQFSIADVPRTYRDAVPQAAMEMLTDISTSQRGFNRWWHRTVGTQLHKAKINKSFGKVYYAVQDFMKDVSRMATLSADLAPDLLPQLDTLADARKIAPQIYNPNAVKNRKADMKAASDALFDGTLRYTRDSQGAPVLATKDGDKGIVWTTGELKARGMSDEAVKLYEQSRAAVNQSLDNLLAADVYRSLTAMHPELLADDPVQLDAMMERIRKAAASDTPMDAIAEAEAAMDAQTEKVEAQITELKAALRDRSRDTPVIQAAIDEVQELAGSINEARETLNAKVERIADLKASGYAPLMRFGEYTVDALDAQGNRVFFGMYESQLAANRAARKFRADGLTVNQGVQSKKEFELLKGVSPETAMLFADMMGMEKNAAMQDWLQKAVAQQSALKRHIRRKGIEGFENDASRVVAAFITSNSRAASRALHGLRIQESVENVKGGDVKDEAIALAEYVNNPKEEAQAIRSLLFVNYIGGSVASAMVNLTQTLVQTFPFLSQYGGVGKAGMRISSAMRQALGKISDPELSAAVDRAVKEGVIKPQEVFQLQAEASRTLGSDIRVRAFLALWGSFFQAAEVYNRRVAFIAGYQTAKEQGIADPYAFAENAVEETQGTFNKGNRPDWARGALGATVFTFKGFTIQYVEFLKRLPPKERAIALGVLVMIAGTAGLPFAGDAEDIIDTVAQQLGYNFTVKDARNRFLVDTFGRGAADFIQFGASPWLPFDVSQRLGMADLLPGTAVLKPSETRKEDQVMEVAGVAGSFVRDILKGEYRPIAIRNLAKAIEMYDMGIYRDTRGRKVIDVDGIDAALKGIGLQPSNVAAESRAVGREYEKRALFTQTKNRITEQMALGQFEGDAEKVEKARQQLMDWNEKNPDARMIVSIPNVWRRVAEMRKDRAERFIKSAPKEIRTQTREALQ